MTFAIDISGSVYRFDPSNPIDLSLPLDFEGNQPSAFGLPRATALVVESPTFVGDTRRGGPCNVATVTVSPHGSGTHTECAGHLTRERFAVPDAIRNVLVPAVLLSVAIEPALRGAGESSDPMLAGDRMISRSAIEAALRGLGEIPVEFHSAVVLRSHAPGEIISRDYTGSNPPYMSLAAAHLLRSLGTDHVVVELPSFDREDDGGILAAHRAFFQIDGERRPRSLQSLQRTITEMATVPDDAPDGLYLLNLQLPNFVLDAAPSRPMLLRVEANRGSR